MDALVTAMAETLATAFVRLCGFRVWMWEFPVGDDRVRVTVDLVSGGNKDESMLGEDVVVTEYAYDNISL